MLFFIKLWYVCSTHWDPDNMAIILQTIIYKCIFPNEMFEFLLRFSQNSVRKSPINNTPALVQIMAWHRSGDKPLSEPMVVDSLTHVCVTRPQCVKTVAMLVLRLQNERPRAHKSMLKASQSISSHWSCFFRHISLSAPTGSLPHKPNL